MASPSGQIANGGGESSIASDVSVVLLDSIGELASLYRLADGVFVGGSLVQSGGHNILEPAAFGKVPVFGESMENFAEIGSVSWAQRQRCKSAAQRTQASLGLSCCAIPSETRRWAKLPDD